MEKKELQIHFEKLTGFHNEFYFLKRDYENGKNKKIREAAYSDLRRILAIFKNYVLSNPVIYNLITDQGGNNTDYSRTIAFEDFASVKYFEDDLESFLKKLEGIINTE